ncbi:MAG: hypothetical protein K6G88_06825 [Lachnospiraceae bacterium]|nr:hypothetical protein [Lachnospiraceae bacterium]
MKKKIVTVFMATVITGTCAMGTCVPVFANLTPEEYMATYPPNSEDGTYYVFSTDKNGHVLQDPDYDACEELINDYGWSEEQVKDSIVDSNKKGSFCENVENYISDEEQYAIIDEYEPKNRNTEMTIEEDTKIKTETETESEMTTEKSDSDSVTLENDSNEFSDTETETEIKQNVSAKQVIKSSVLNRIMLLFKALFGGVYE